MSFFSTIQLGKPHQTRELVDVVEHDIPAIKAERFKHTVISLNSKAAEFLPHDDTHVTFAVDAETKDTILLCFTPSVDQKGKKLSLKNSFRDQNFANRLSLSTIEETVEYLELERITSFMANSPDGRSTVLATVPDDIVAFRIGDRLDDPIKELNVANSILTDVQSYA